MMRKLRWSNVCAFVSCMSALGLAALPAAAQDARALTPDSDALGSHQHHFRVDLGGRGQFIKDRGFDPFSEKDALGQLALSASYAFWARERLSLAAVVEYDYGSSSASARSAEASLDLNRFVLAPELRYHVLRIAAATAKLGPTLTRESATLSNGLGSDLHKMGYKFGFEATLGAAVEVWGFQSGSSKKPRLWVTGEGGYAWTAPMALRFEPEESSAVPQRLASVAFHDLTLAGPLFRIGFAVSF